ncbi:CIC11C00000003686 [Sungouiella intermedia]|uniref:CIC11C00000003686 n=1 Tax=Sungouiella intermedia TaxID=45354 RepID=A0A1L0BAY0_9ASCO|nr:CIC11C00000003686 [[Candida] intermedia]
MSWFTSLLLLLLLANVFADSLVAHPGIQFLELGGQIGVLGLFSGLSFYDYTNASAFLSSSDDSQSLYLRNTSSNENVKIATVSGGSVTQLQQLTDDLVLIVGDFSSFNDVSYQPPIIYNVSSGDVETIFSLTLKRADEVSGNVITTFVDGDVVYLGGDFEYNGTYGAAVYNFTSKSISSLPFEGFGQNSTVNSITKYDNGEEGSIIFGGSFDTLGLPELLTHNITLNLTSLNSTNSTNSSLISAEQVVSLKHATISNVNGGSGSDSSLICPSNDVTWSVQDGEGGQWLAELPLGMRGISPTKIRLYVPNDSSDGIRLFRLYTYPNNGIMNLTYVDPSTNELAYCDAWCPLLLGSDLQEHTDDNIDDADFIMEDDNMFVNDDGSFTMYYDSSTKSKNLGYGRNYQEFALINDVAIDKLGLTVTAWYGSKAELSGVELYLNSIRVYGNETLNDSNCGGESEINSAAINNGTWQSVQSLSDSVSNTNYLVSVVDNNSAAITLYPNISYAGYYSILLYTPGCSADGSCSNRSIVSVSVIDTDDQVVASSQLYQNNLDDKFDFLFYGHLNGSSTSDGKNRVVILYESAIDPSVERPWVVVDKVVANIVSLDHYYLKNTTNTTNSNNETDSKLLTVSLNGLFEYSLGNFTDFEKDLVYTKVGNKTIIKDTNSFVGNSSINLLSGEFSLDSVIRQVLLQNSSDSTNFLLLGDFTSSNSSLLDKSILTLSIGGYNSTSNSTIAQLAKRKLLKRADVEYLGVLFNNTISALHDFDGGFVVTGAFSASSSGNSSAFKNLENNNLTTSTANNFALYLDGSWYSFGNNFTSANYSRFVQIEIEGNEYFVFSTDNNEYEVWDNTNHEWATSSGNLDISTAVTLDGRDQQIIGGSSFGVMDFYGNSEAYFNNNTQFNSFGLNVTSGSLLSSFFVNPTLSVIGGKFNAEQSISNIALLQNNVASSLNGSASWADNAAVTTIYIDNLVQYLFLGTNGSVLTGSNNVTGLVIYNLNSKSFSSVQPATLSTNDNSDIEVNALVYYDQGKQLLVGGHFDNAGSLDCPSICIYDVQNTRWTNPLSGGSSLSIGGNVTDAKFLSSNQVLLSGNLTINGTDVTFAVYNFATGLLLSAGSALNNDINGPQKYIINERSSGELTNRLAAYGEGFVKGFNGSNWNSIDSGIAFNSNTKFTDLKLVKLSEANSANPSQQYFDNDKVLMLSGVFNLTNYGLVNAALFDGNSWIPYIFSSLLSSGLGMINSLLLEDVYRYQSSSDLETPKKGLSTGKIVGISLACAIGSTALIGALFLIPMFFLFKDTKKRSDVGQRIHEDDMMDAVNPEELLHEIDIQRK